MPTYEYKCTQEEAHPLLEITRSIKEAEGEYTCVVCEAPMTKCFNTFGIQFKGSGFYKTDNG
jgi:putative FmdB family regulatory protein